MGRIIGAGTATVARCYGIERAPLVKGQAMPAYDPRAVKGVGVTYATSTQGADHTAGYAVTSNILGIVGIGGKTDALSAEGQAELSDVVALGKSILQQERDFNARAGFTKAHDRLPLYFKRESVAPHNVRFDVSDEDLDSVFTF